MIRIMWIIQYPIVGIFSSGTYIYMSEPLHDYTWSGWNMKVLLYLSDPHKNNEVSA